MKKLLNIFMVIVMMLSIAVPTTKVSAATKPAKVKLSSVTASSSTSIKIKWKKVSGADGYVIYQKVGSGSYKKIKTITSGKTTSYTKKNLTSAKKYTYKIKAYDKSGSKKIYGAYSNTKSAYTKPAKVKLSSLTASSSTSIKIKWKKVSGADGYVIYQKVGSGSYKKIKTITSGKTTSYTKKKLSANKKYTYKIKAYKMVGSKKIYGSYSSTKSVKTKCSQKYDAADKEAEKAQRIISRQKLNISELETELNNNFGKVNIGIDTWDLSYTVEKNDSNFWPEDICVRTSWTSHSVGVYDLKYSIDYTKQQKDSAIAALKAIQKKIYDYVYAKYPALKIKGCYYSYYYKYPAIHEGYTSTSFLTWTNYGGDWPFSGVYDTKFVTGFSWQTDTDDYQF